MPDDFLLPDCDDGKSAYRRNGRTAYRSIGKSPYRESGNSAYCASGKVLTTRPVIDLTAHTRIQGRDAKALKKLPALSNLHARKNIAFIGPEGIGKTHLAQAYGRECCMQGYKTYYLKASELKARLEKAVAENRAESVVNFMVKPSCLIIDEVGRRRMDRECTNLFFDIVDRRYEKEGPNTLILTSNIPANNWDEFFTGDDTLLCALDRMFDRASVFMMKGPSYRGRECDTYSVEAVPTVLKANNG